MQDLISRQAAIAKFKPWLKVEGYSEGELNMLKAVLFELTVMPSAQPERKTGRWIDGKRMKNDGTFYWFRQCDQCGYERNDCDTEKDSNFCPDCGADMRQIGEQDGERQRAKRLR